MKTVLIVDDNPLIRGILATFLQDDLQMEICGEAVDGLQAIKTAQERKPDLIVMDLSMPAMNGAEAASVLKQLMPQTRIVMFTLYSDFMGQSMAKACGVDLVLSKADGTTKLLAALKTLLGDGHAH